MNYIVIILVPDGQHPIAHFATRDFFGRIADHVLNLLNKNGEYAALRFRVRIFEG